MRKYVPLLAVSSVSLLFSACEKPEVTTNGQSESSAELAQSDEQEKLIADQAARIKELEEKEQQYQVDRIQELEQREQELLASIEEQKRLAEEAAKVVKELPQPVIAGEPPVQAIEVLEDPVVVEGPYQPVEPGPYPDEDLPITDIGYDFDYPTDYEYDPGYQPALVEHIDYHAYVSYDWYQYHIVRERVFLQQESHCNIQIRSVLLDILRARIAYENHRKIKHHLRDKVWHTRLALLHKQWLKNRSRDREVIALRKRLANINTSRLNIAAERERRLRDVRKHPGWKERELRQKKLVENQRSDLVQAWLKEKKLRQDQEKAYRNKIGPGKTVSAGRSLGNRFRKKPEVIVDRSNGINANNKSEVSARLRELERKRREQLSLSAERKNREEKVRRITENSVTRIDKGPNRDRQSNSGNRVIQNTETVARNRSALEQEALRLRNDQERVGRIRQVEERTKREKAAREQALREQRARAAAASQLEISRRAAEQAARDKAERERLEIVRGQQRSQAIEEQRRRAAEEQRRKAIEEQRRKAAEEQRRKAIEEQRRKAAEEQRRRAIEEQRRKAAEEQRRKLEEERAKRRRGGS